MSHSHDDIAQHPHLLHIFSPTKYVSPFDINMAYEAKFDAVIPYCNVELDEIQALTQDTIFSRGPNGVKRTGIFIGGRDVGLAADMLDACDLADVLHMAHDVGDRRTRRRLDGRSLQRHAREVGEAVVAAALLHDTVEDTSTEESDLRRLFGDRIAAIVMEVTDDQSLRNDVSFTARRSIRRLQGTHLLPRARAALRRAPHTRQLPCLA